MSKKKQDPQALKAEFETWKASEQYKYWLELHELQRQKLHLISETSKDMSLNGRFQILWDAYYKFALFLKVKPVLKELRHEWVRSMFFGELIKDQNQKGEKQQPAKYDGVVIDLPKDIHDSQNNLRQTLFKGIYNNFDDLDPMTLNQTNFQKKRSDLKKAFVQLFKRMKNHLKKPYKFVYEEILMSALKPIKNFLQANARLYLFELKHRAVQDKFIYQFKRKAYIDKFCQNLQELLRILNQFESKPLQYTPDMRRVIFKLDYDWRNNTIEKWYLSKLDESLQTLKRNSMCLFSIGINFWTCPLENNAGLVKDIIRLVNWEVITDRILGNQIVRSQLNFIFDVVQIIHQAHQLSAQFLKLNDRGCMDKAIPFLAAFKSAQRMRDIADRKALQAQKQKRFPSLKKQPELIPQMSVTTQSFKKNATSTKDLKDIKEDKAQQTTRRLQMQQIAKFGRYYIWEGFLDQQHKMILEDCAQRLKHINKAVQQDIQDNFIKEGMLPDREGANIGRLKQAVTSMNAFKTQNNANKKSKMVRPPQLWNYPKVVQEIHQFRAVAQPKKCYIDGRIQELELKLKKVGNKLKTHNQTEWDEIVSRCIDHFRGQQNQVIHK